MSINKRCVAIGLMSGTSMDGIDAALLETDGRHVLAVGPFLTIPYSPMFRERLRLMMGQRPTFESFNVE